ncbi:MAG TPA: galactokinase, partial [Verrucomicrobiales bacterium]|nr:galactokinase [Verrucomicrobiales bacterium]
TGHLSDQVARCFGFSYGPLKLQYSVEESPRGTGGALRLANSQVDTDSVLVLNGDSFCEVDLAGFWRAHVERRAKASMVLHYQEDTRRFGRVTMMPDSRLENFLEKGDLVRPGWINAGIYLLPKAWIEAIPEGREVSLERDLLPGWLAGGIYGYPSSGRFIDIGTPESFAQAGEFFAGDRRLAP